MSKQRTKAERLARWMVPLALILLALVAIYISTTFKKMPPILKRGIQPSDFPQLVCGLIIVLSALMMWRDPVKFTERVSPMTWATLGMLGGFVLLMQIDFFLALGTFAASLAFLWGERRPTNLAIVGVAVPGFIFFLFDFVFKVRFPRGALTNLWYG